ncbi:hypothetical protein LPJ66_004023 [Kickxella alabastrina]|uniref:Uncharacterized protein n=1 Tax=Kickxella alabastrina TaxID=61397 RepID=A0ACC1IKU7_9FUNG|nr:hypothetical protein LPJ66_004023 [Kickxella alabastrina]
MRFNMLLSAAMAVLSTATTVVVQGYIIGYYPLWQATNIVGLDFSKYTHINMAFGIPNDDGSITYDGIATLESDVAAIQAKNTKALLSVGGWSGSSKISTILKDNTTRSAFLTAMVDFIKTYNLDGIDIDWEYPGRLGNACNAFDEANDTPNFLTFLQDLRAELDSQFGDRIKLITMAVYVEPFHINGVPSDVTEFAKVVDFANLMQYDINGAWNPETGPNGPFDFEQGKGTPFSFVSAIDAWTGNGWPANQLTGGVAFYGRSTTATVDMTLDPENQYQAQSKVVPLGDSDDAEWLDVCAGATSVSGNWKWKNLRSQGVLTDPETAALPWVRHWDPISQTPWLFNPETNIFISYDDPKSIKIKMDYAQSKGLAGVMSWSMEMDYSNELLDPV